MKWTLAAVLCFFAAAPWFLLDAWCASRLGAWRLDLTVVWLLFAALRARVAALPWLLACAAVGRSVAFGGTLWLHVLLLGIPLAVLVPARRLAATTSRGLWQVGAVVILSLTLPRLAGFLHRWTDAAELVLPGSFLVGAIAVVLAPPAAALLARMPPLWFYAEHRR